MTYKVAACPCCGALRMEERQALIASFISEYVLGRAPVRSALLHCKVCDAMFFRDRFTPAEIDKLYTDYRGTDYFAARNHLEPWYTRRFNDHIGALDGLSGRQAVYRSAVASVGLAEPETVLDYGGDSGQLMVGGPGARLFVYDISGAPPADGITAITDAKGLGARTFDLVLLCHVLEHFSEPLAGAMDVAQHVKPGGLMFVEVPFERFPIEDIPRNGWYARYLDFLCRHPLILRLADFWSTAVRVKLHRIPPLGFAKMHEHLNYFSVGSLSALLARAGLTVLRCEVAPTTQVVFAVCQRPALKA